VGLDERLHDAGESVDGDRAEEEDDLELGEPRMRERLIALFSTPAVNTFEKCRHPEQLGFT
jgi:hypothetical protein